MILLRCTVAALHSAGHEVALLAPAVPGSALVGPGPSEAQALLPWDGPEIASLLGGAPPAGALAECLARTDATIAFTRSPDVAARLREVAPRVIVRDPEPRDVRASLWLADAARELGAVADPHPPDLQPTPQEEAAARAFPARLPPRFLALHPGSGSPGKNWPRERFLGLARALAPGRPWLLVAGPADEAAVNALGAETGAVVAQSLALRVLGAVLARAGLFVGNDSGVSHLAAGFGAPSLALFGPTDPAIWAPVGRRAHSLRSPDGSMAGLSLDAVLAAARSVR